MLERQLLLQSRGGGIDAVKNPIDTSESPLIKHKELHLPPLCRRYDHLPLTSNWFLELLANQNKKRPHRKSHGLIPFKELAQIVAKNYREIDDETQAFVNEVAERLGWHCEDLEVMEERERREEEELARTRGFPMGPTHLMGNTFNTTARIEGQLGGVGGKKRKEAPVVSSKGAAAAAAGANTSLSLGEAHTVQQLIGMKRNSPPMVGLPSHGPLPAFPGGQHSQPMISPGPAHSGDNESERLKIELAHAMNARLESEHRIQLLKQQMTVHHARTRMGEHARAVQVQAHSQAQAAAHSRAAAAAQAARGPPSQQRSALNTSLPAGYERYLSMLAGGSPPPHSHLLRAPGPPASTKTRQSPEQKPQAPDLAKLEKELLEETLIRRLVPRGGAAAVHAATGTAPVDAHGVAYEEAMNRLAKRARYSEDGEAAAKKSAEGQEARRAPSADAAAARAPSADPRSDDISFYKDLYSKLMAPRHPPPSPRESAHAATRDLAYFDSLAVRSLHHGVPPSGADQAFLGSLARGGGHPPLHLMPPQHRPSPRMKPCPPPSTDRHPGGQISYSAILAQIAASRGVPAGGAGRASGVPPLPQLLPPPASDSPSARAAAAANLQSQFGLSYNDIMDVWKEMNEKKAGELGDSSERGPNQMGKKEEE